MRIFAFLFAMTLAFPALGQTTRSLIEDHVASHVEDWSFEDFSVTQATDGAADTAWRFINGAAGQTLTITNANHAPGDRVVVLNVSTNDLALNISGGAQFQNGESIVSSLTIAPGDVYTITRNTGLAWSVVSRLLPDDNAATIEQWIAGVAITSTNGSPINPGDEYISFPNGDTWASDPLAADVDWAITTDDGVGECFDGRLNNPAGSFRATYQVPVTFTPSASGAYLLRLHAPSVLGSGYVLVGTAAGGNDILPIQAAADRINVNDRDKTYVLSDLNAGVEYHVTMGAGGGAAVIDPCFEIRPVGDEAFSPTGTQFSGIYEQLDRWERTSSSGPQVEMIDGDLPETQSVVLTGDTGGWSFLRLSADTPLTIDRLVKITWRKDASATHTSALRIARAGVVADVIFEPSLGTAVSASPTRVDVISNVQTDDSVTTIMRFIADPAWDSWQIYPDYGNSGTLASSNAATGSFEIAELDLNYSGDLPETTPILGETEITKGIYDTPTAVVAGGVAITTGIDLTDAYRIEASISAAANDSHTAVSSVLMEEIALDTANGGLLHWHDSIYIRVRVNSADLAAGIINVVGVSSNGLQIEQIRVTKLAQATVGASRVGEFFFAKSGLSRQGVVPVTPGTIVNGAVDNPLWAALYPEYVVGNDIVFPANVAGQFLRNLGGGAEVEGVLQADATAPNGLNVVSRFNRGENTTANGGAFRLTGSGSEVSVNGVVSGDPETRPANRAYQLYTIVDSYPDLMTAELPVKVSNLVRYSAYSPVDDTNISNGEFLQQDIMVGAETPHIDTHGVTFSSAVPYNPVIPKDGVYRVEYRVSADYEDGDEAFSYNLLLDGVVVDRQWASINNDNGGEELQSLVVGYTGPLTTASVLGMEADALTSDITINNMSLSIIELPVATIVSGDVPANDNSAAGYMDIGNMRMQWGNDASGGGARAISLPAPFADATYSVTVTPQYVAAGGRYAAYSGRTTTGFNVRAYTTGGTDSGVTVSWQAIGLRPQ